MYLFIKVLFEFCECLGELRKCDTKKRNATQTVLFCWAWMVFYESIIFQIHLQEPCEQQ